MLTFGTRAARLWKLTDVALHEFIFSEKELKGAIHKVCLGLLRPRRGALGGPLNACCGGKRVCVYLVCSRRSQEEGEPSCRWLNLFFVVILLRSYWLRTLCTFQTYIIMFQLLRRLPRV